MVTYAPFDKLIGIKIGSYRLEQFVEQNRWGPVFLARTDPAAHTYLLRILAWPSNIIAREREAYLERFQHQANQIATLQHPDILPLLDYGSYRGMPYLVFPHTPTRSLHARLMKNGPMDIFIVGRYLDQIAAALEYAHQHAVLHGNLSVESIFTRLDGHLIVADFGMARMFELSEHSGQRKLFYGSSATCAPEQLLGKPVGAYTDVYALGAVLYQLLTGSQVFSGSTFNEIAQQHLYAPVPLLNAQRPDLPADLYSIITRALAKDPMQRFSQAGALANAYHRIVAPVNKARVPFVITSSHEDHKQEPSIALQSEVQHTEQMEDKKGLAVMDSNDGLQRSMPLTPLPQALPLPDTIGRRHAPRPPLRQNKALITLLIALLLVMSSMAGVALLAKQNNAVSSSTGQVTFFDSQNGSPGHTDALSLVVHGLNAPPAGSQYNVWFINDQSEEIIALGTLTENGQTFAMNYSEETGKNLLGAGDKIEITQEQGAVKLPVGKVVLVGTFPARAFLHVQHLLVSIPSTPGKIGVLVGLLNQTRLANVQADVLQNVAANRNTVAVQCAAQSIIDIIEGSQGLHYKSLTTTCARQNVTASGDGLGILGKGYTLDAAEHAILAASQPDTTNTLRIHSRLVELAASNIKGWLTTADQDAVSLRDNPTNLTKVQPIVTLCDHAYHGVDMDNDGQINPVTGEAGATTAYLQGQQMITLSLAAGS